MSPRQFPAPDDGAPRSEDEAKETGTSTPDEAGPHDVPDEDVIEATLPSKSRPDKDRP